MEKALKVSAGLINNIHDFIIYISSAMGLSLTDKGLHFWTIGVIGLVLFLVADKIFRRLAKWSISSISFIFTFIFLTVLVFGLEIEQKITGRGNMEFADIVSGLWGFIVLFVVYLIVIGAVYLVKRLYNRKKHKLS
ncbi:hypothetical protein [Pelotomaculum propionicicum]|uniref:Uncharacterized protein n=1 Tax=Pelotomaculum propionicicum TaxID=258475 RepID=A0A4Y7RPM5_9FIRM|nr:hypothetical protein [Pelotomaculum propionicicum]NLI14270.1 hypothetical protein [Peptococcaceae bacterium]TEB10968.1 hypothetical protein Pmgp_01984 [Pelotomaculum propionicicum]